LKRLFRRWVLEKLPFFKRIEAILARKELRSALQRSSLNNTAKLEGKSQELGLLMKSILEENPDEDILYLRNAIEDLGEEHSQSNSEEVGT